MGETSSAVCGHVALMLFGQRGLGKVTRARGGRFPLVCGRTGKRSCSAPSQTEGTRHVNVQTWEGFIPAPQTGRSRWSPVALHREILNPRKCYTSAAVKQSFSSLLKDSQVPVEQAAAVTLLLTGNRLIPENQPPLCYFHSQIQSLRFHTREAEGALWSRHLGLCCIRRNEREHVVFAPLMRCRVIYL